MAPGSIPDIVIDDMRRAIRAQLIALANDEITATRLGQIQRFTAAASQALMALERPGALVRSRFNIGGVMQMADYGMGDVGEDSLAGAPNTETYGANATRNLVGQIVKAAESVNKKPPSMTDLVRAIAEAKRSKLGRDVVKSLEDQLKAQTQVHESGIMIEPADPTHGPRKPAAAKPKKGAKP